MTGGRSILTEENCGELFRRSLYIFNIKAKPIQVLDCIGLAVKMNIVEIMVNARI